MEHNHKSEGGKSRGFRRYVHARKMQETSELANSLLQKLCDLAKPHRCANIEVGCLQSNIRPFRQPALKLHFLGEDLSQFCAIKARQIHTLSAH